MSRRLAKKVLVIGSGPDAPDAADIPRGAFDSIVCINNAWRVRADWDYSIFPDDFPPEKRAPTPQGNQSLISNAEYLPGMQSAGGLPLCGATMAFAAGYWVLHRLRPAVVAFTGCDMDYTPKEGKTHFYGTGTADPLRKNITLRDLRAKSGRLFLKGLNANVMFVNLSKSPKSSLVFPRTTVDRLERLANSRTVSARVRLSRNYWTSRGLALRASWLEKQAPTEFTESKAYWKYNDRKDIQVVIDRIDALWKRAALGVVAVYQPHWAP